MHRQQFQTLLVNCGIGFKSEDNGAHLTLQGKRDLIDFWPDTEKFITRNGQPGRGVLAVLELCNTDKLAGESGDATNTKV